jgi:hypothetical protein
MDELLNFPSEITNVFDVLFTHYEKIDRVFIKLRSLCQRSFPMVSKTKVHEILGFGEDFKSSTLNRPDFVKLLLQNCA